MAGSDLFLTASARRRWTLTTETRASYRNLGPNTGRKDPGALISTMAMMRREVIRSGERGIVRVRCGGGSGYLILHNGGPGRVARALQSGRQINLFPFPEKLIELREAELIRPDAFELRAVEPHGRASANLEGVFPGARNESLFLCVRLWAYKQRRGADLGAWCARVRDFTLHSNTRFPHPLIAREAVATAYSVSTWVWSAFNEIIPSKGKGPLDHSSIAQSWRGTWGGRASGVSRRRGTHARDRAIIQAVERGESMRAVAGEHGIAVGTVHWIVRRSLNSTTGE